MLDVQSLTSCADVAGFQIFFQFIIAGASPSQLLVEEEDTAFHSSGTFPVHEVHDVTGTSEVLRILFAHFIDVQLQAASFFHPSIDGAGDNDDLAPGTIRFEILVSAIFVRSTCDRMTFSNMCVV